MSKSTYAVVIAMVALSAGIVWIYYTTPVTSPEPEPFYKNKALYAVNERNIVKVFYIFQDDNGRAGKPVGCGDSVIGVDREIPATTTPLVAALSLLLADKHQIATSSAGETYNALYKSNLKIKSINMKEGVADIKLTGTVVLGGECDNPRFEAQLMETAMQFQTVEKANFYINGRLLEEAMSLK